MLAKQPKPELPRQNFRVIIERDFSHDDHHDPNYGKWIWQVCDKDRKTWNQTTFFTALKHFDTKEEALHDFKNVASLFNDVRIQIVQGEEHFDYLAYETPIEANYLGEFPTTEKAKNAVKEFDKCCYAFVDTDTPRFAVKMPMFTSSDKLKFVVKVFKVYTDSAEIDGDLYVGEKKFLWDGNREKPTFLTNVSIDGHSTSKQGWHGKFEKGVFRTMPLNEIKLWKRFDNA